MTPMTLDALRAAAESGQHEAQLQFGIAHMTGEGGLTPDPQTGREWLGRAADNGNAAAARFLGLIYLRGMDTPTDLEQARSLLEKSAGLGDAEAGWWLASYLAGSRDEHQDLKAARLVLERAANAGYPRAMTHLAYLLDVIDGQSRAPGDAGGTSAQLLVRAATAGDGGALLALAEWFEHGHWVEKNAGRARWLAQQAAERGWEIAGEYAQGIKATPVPGLPQESEFSATHSAPLPSPSLEVHSWTPRVLLFHRLLSVFECAEIAMAAREHVKPSFIVNQDGELGYNDIRTSHEVRLRPGLRNLVVNTVEQRMADWSHFPIEHGELPLVLRYEKQQSFEQHFDYFIPERFAMGEGPLEFGGQRVATQLVYLNQGFSGGQTLFNNADLEIMPERGMCMLFYNVGPHHNVDPLTRHTGVAVSGGVKWLLSRWIRELPHDQPASEHARDRYLGS